MTLPSRVLIRCDAASGIGTGHVMRCLALAQALQDLGSVPCFVMAHTTPAIECRLQDEHLEVFRIEPDAIGTVVDAEMTGAVAGKVEATCLILDGYRFTAEYQQQICAFASKLLVIDDNGSLGHYHADLILDQSPCADGTLYAHRLASTRLLLGSSYVLLRREFAKWSDWRREIPNQAHKLMVCIGGSDPGNLTARLGSDLAALRGGDLEIALVVSGDSPHLASVQDAVRSDSTNFRLHRDISDIPQLLAWADVGILGAGVTAVEGCAMGLPSILFPIADNQIPVANCLRRLGAVWTLESDYTTCAFLEILTQLLSSKKVRCELSRRGQTSADFFGAKRVANIILSS